MVLGKNKRKIEAVLMSIFVQVKESTGFMQVYGTTIIFSLVNIFVPMVITRVRYM